MEITRHFTATVLIVYQNKVLLHKHKKRHVLLPVGGHLDRDELPEEAALREVLEETGLEVKLHDTDSCSFADTRKLIRPMHILLIDINDFHQHIDLIFYARAKTNRLNPASGESSEFYWLEREEVLTTPMPENVRGLALEALDLLKE